eukprot:scaffold110386_cov50-Phaeocystis_antarctica.AAC.2
MQVSGAEAVALLREVPRQLGVQVLHRLEHHLLGEQLPHEAIEQAVELLAGRAALRTWLGLGLELGPGSGLGLGLG